MTLASKAAAIALGTAAFAGGMTWSGEIRPTTSAGLYSQAEARVGRPLTPVSYAGVARRTTRRAAYTRAAAAAATPNTTVVVVPPPAVLHCMTPPETWSKPARKPKRHAKSRRFDRANLSKPSALPANVTC
jgi:hypothetical protein